MSTRGNTDRICGSDIKLNAVDKASAAVAETVVTQMVRDWL
jgi:hypothetical protein